jgi:hypothetical protein
MPTYTQIGSAVTVGAGGTGTIVFSSIPSTYTDLVLVASLRFNAGQDWAGVYFNSDTTAANYSQKNLFGNGSTAGSQNLPTYIYTLMGTQSGYTANTFSNCQMYIPNYAGSTAKSYSVENVQENNATSSQVTLDAHGWTGTAAINTITITTTNANLFVQHSTAYLYGVSNA